MADTDGGARDLVKESALNNSQPIDLSGSFAGLDAVELQGLIGMGGKACDSGGHEAPFPPG